MRAPLFLLAALVTGCASMNDALTPSMSVMKDDFDGSTIVRQDPVSAASSISEAWHVLGFEWSNKHPDTVFITVGYPDIVNITDVAFNVDGQILDRIRPASSLTEYGELSTRRFQMPYEDFAKLATGKDVKMKVSQINTYTVSSFGANNPATVSPKFPPFLAKIKELRGR